MDKNIGLVIDLRKLDFDALKNLSLVSHIGIIMILPIIGGVYLGNYLDNRLGTGSVFLLVGIILGVITAFMNLFKIAIRKSKKRDE